MALSLRELLETWHAAEADPVARARLDVLALARDALALGQPHLADEALREAVARPDAAVELRYTAALAAARLGSLRRAQRLVDALLADPAARSLQVDARALAGRIAKDRWARLAPGAQRDAAGRQALAAYRDAWDATRDPFPGINAATLLLLTGAPEAARALAREVRVAAREAADMAVHWRAATLAEAALLLDEQDNAAAHYRDAVRAALGRVGDVASMRRQLRLLAGVLPLSPQVEAALALPRVAVFSGHMLDAPERAEPRFPAALEAPVAAAIAARIEALDIGFGYCAAACGSDLLFVEALLARGAEVHLVLPFPREDFLATSVAHAGEAWVARFDAALARATSVTYGVRERYLGDDSLFVYAARLMQGAARLRARQLEAEPLLLAVVDPTAPRRPGGTVDVLTGWRDNGLHAECIDLAALRVQAGVDGAAPLPPPPPAPHGGLRRDLRTMLFADMVGYSRLAEEDTPAFLAHFLGAIADVVAQADAPPQFVNTWGDGLFMVFDAVEQGAAFALRLRDAVARCDWPARGLPAATSIRIALHSGPVFQAHDRLIRRQNYFGAHVIRAARMEPVVAPGAVYVSAELACLLAAGDATEFATDYLGILPLAKSHGSCALYRLRGVGEEE